MKRKFKRFQLLILFVFMCIYLTGCAEKNTNVSNVKVSFDSQSITVSSPDDNAFTLTLEIESNSTKSYWTSQNLFVAKDVPHTYNLKDLVGDYISENAQITSVSIETAVVTDYGDFFFTLAIICFVVGFIFGVILS